MQRNGPSVVVALAVAATAVGLGVFGMTAASAATAGAITGYGGKCVDVSGANSTNGTRIQLWTCNGTNAQQWTVGSDGTIRALGKCMDVSGAGTANGTRVQIWDCNGTGAQSWRSSGTQLINTNSNKCLDATGWGTADGTPLQIWDCTGGANQQWQLPTGGGGGGVQAAAPYLYLGWGNPPDPRTVMSATGIRWFTMAFMLSNGYCNPQWDGWRALTGGVDQSTITNIRGAGGDVVVSSGGATGNWLEQSCGSAGELAGAYQRVINAYGLRALDIDIEGSVYASATLQQRTIDALKTVRANNPGITLYVTFPSGQWGPDSSMINRAAQSGLTVDGWTIMPFDFGAAGQNMGNLTIQATDGLKNTVRNAYGYTDDQAYRHSGISSMNGITDQGETVTVNDFRTILGYAQQHHLARLTFWSTNRDRPCTGGSSADSCSGVGQNDWDYTRIIAGYTG